MVDITALTDQAVDLAIAYAPKLIGAIVVLVIGLWIIKLIKRTVERSAAKKLIEPTLKRFMLSLVDAGLKIMLFITVISMLGVQMTSFVAILAAAGFAIGLSLQGSLANFAGGVLILLTKPFKVGHFIDAEGQLGTVHEIGILHTTLKTPGNTTVIMPNGPLANSIVTNFSLEDKRRVDLVFGIGYDDDLKKAKKELERIFTKSEMVLQEPAPDIRVKGLGESSVDLNVRFWVESKDYWPAITDFNEEVKLAFDKKGLSIPYPQRDVHLHKK
jgi:small conductance mechanosensitive channel